MVIELGKLGRSKGVMDDVVVIKSFMINQTGESETAALAVAASIIYDHS